MSKLEYPDTAVVCRRSLLGPIYFFEINIFRFSISKSFIFRLRNDITLKF